MAGGVGPGVRDGVAGGEFWAGEMVIRAHAAGDVIFVVEAVGEDGDSAARDDLANEDDAAPEFAGDFAAHIIAKVDLGEVGVPGERDAEEADVFETEADDADVGLTVVEVRLSARRRESRDDFGRHCEVEQEQIAPGGGENGTLGHDADAGSRRRDAGPL